MAFRSSRLLHARLTPGGLIAIVILVLAMWPARSAGQSTAQIPSVLMLFSLRSTAPSVENVEIAFRRVLEEQMGGPVDFRVEYLDLPDEGAVPYVRRLSDLLVNKYAGQAINVVVVQRPEALSYVLDNRKTLFPGVPIVFTDVTPDELERMPRLPDVTGAIREAGGTRTIAVAIDLLPDTRHVAIVAGSSPFDRRNADFAHGLVQAKAPGLEVLSFAGLPLNDQLQRVAALPEKTLVVFTSFRADASGRSMVGAEVARLVARASNAPVFGAADTFLGTGIVGGDLIQYKVLAERAAALTARLLKGEPPASLAPIAGPSSAFMFDWRQLQRWRIDERRLPAGSIVSFREQTLWSQYKWPLTGVGALLFGESLLVSALLVQARQRKRAQVGLAEAEQRYRTVADFTADWEYWLRPDGSLAYVSPSCLRTTGHDAEEFIKHPSLLIEIIVEEDRAKWSAHETQARNTAGPSSLEYRIRTKTGDMRWIDHLCSPVTAEDGSDLGLRVSNRDITTRKQSEEDLRRALEEIQGLRDQLEIDNTYLRQQLQPERGIEGLLGTSDVMRYVISKIQQVAPTSSTVLLLGETGVGKSLVAQAIHNLSTRRARPLVTLNCAALPPGLIESELFGHEKGSFTGAQTRRPGRFEMANGGALFLDEIGDLPLDLQGKLLRAVQDGEFERVGSNVTIKTDVRLIAATNRKLDDEVRAGRFRQDLWYRLNVFPITIPPLRQRVEDIPLLLNHFVEKHCHKLGKPVLQISKATMKTLQAREWAGNIRELENVVERAVISSDGSRLELDEDSPVSDRASFVRSVAPEMGATLEQLEHDHIVATLERLHWRVEGEGGAAEALGINASTLRGRIRKHGIQRPGSRPVASVS